MLLTQMVIIAMITETGIINAKWDNLTESDYQWPKVFFRDNGQQIKGAMVTHGDLYVFYDINSGNLYQSLRVLNTWVIGFDR